jgi:hypothetical protein
MNADVSDLNGSSDSIYQVALQIIPTIKATDLRVQSFKRELPLQEVNSILHLFYTEDSVLILPVLPPAEYQE